MKAGENTATSEAVPWATLGACIGVLAGMTASPVIGTVIASLIAAATLAVSVLGRFAASRAEPRAPRAEAGDVKPLVVLALTVVIVAMATAFVRSAIVQKHQDGEVVRALSAPPDVERIIDSWVRIGRQTTSGLDKGAAPTEMRAEDGGARTDGAGGVFTREEIARWLLGRRATREERSSAETSATVPILYGSDDASSLQQSCSAKPCEEGAGDAACLRRTFRFMKNEGSKEFSAIARALEGRDAAGKHILDETTRHVVFGKIVEGLC